MAEPVKGLGMIAEGMGTIDPLMQFFLPDHPDQPFIISLDFRVGGALQPCAEPKTAKPHVAENQKFVRNHQRPAAHRAVRHLSAAVGQQIELTQRAFPADGIERESWFELVLLAIFERGLQSRFIVGENRISA